MLEFKVNNYIKLKLEDGSTNIYINGKLFDQCKYILTRKRINELEDLLKLDSIDELEKRLDHSLEGITPDLINIPAETRFWVHCSNLQVWAENNYNTRLLHSNLSFPLLRKLSQIGDDQAKRVFKDEIIERIKSQNLKVIKYLILEKYLEEFNDRELKFLMDDTSIDLLKIVIEGRIELEYLKQLLIKIEKAAQRTLAKKINNYLEKQNYYYIEELIQCNFFNYLFLNGQTLVLILKDLKINYFQVLRSILKRSPYLINNIYSQFSNINKKIMKLLKAKIKESIETNNIDAVILILKCGLIEMFYNEQEQQKLLKEVDKKIFNLAENELRDPNSKMHNTEDRLYFIKKIKKKLNIK